jgi:carboxyl-terminal processing protease
MQFVLERANVEVHSVKQELLEPGYGYIRISQFSETTSHDLTRAIAQIKSRSPGGIKGLVLDLRNNPGGVLEAAASVSDAFLDEGVIVTADGRTPEARFELDATKGDLIDGAALTVLVDGGSASSSEIVAGALRDHHRATLIGQKTYGKGLVQTVMPLADGRALKLTTSRYYTPSGESINTRGIIPDIVVDDQHLRDFIPAPMTAALARRDYEVGLALDALKRTSIRQSSLR